jgi:hypothetical protein
MADKVLYLQRKQGICQAEVGNGNRQGCLTFCDQSLAQIKDVLMRLRYPFIALLFLGFISRIRAFQLLGMAASSFDLP